MQKRLNTIQANGSTKAESKETKYKCPKCKDLEFIIENNVGRDCECRELRIYEEILENSGISTAFKNKTFGNYNIEGKAKTIINAKEAAMDYVRNYKQISTERNHSIAFLGQVGAGKTHLSIAIANNLMKKLVAVLYMPYRDTITQLKQLITNEESYQREINKYKSAKVLLIDDLYKGKITESDHNIMFEIINYRYLKGLPIIISSEKTALQFLDYDEATGSRIIEMCKGRLIEFEGIELNHRLNS